MPVQVRFVIEKLTWDRFFSRYFDRPIPQLSDFTRRSSTTEVISATDSVLPSLGLHTVNIAFYAVA
jgi:hypothetical protein